MSELVLTATNKVLIFNGKALTASPSIPDDTLRTSEDDLLMDSQDNYLQSTETTNYLLHFEGE